MRRPKATNERATIASAAVPIAKASGAAAPAAPTASVTLKAIAMVGATIASDRATASIRPRFFLRRAARSAAGRAAPALTAAKACGDDGEEGAACAAMACRAGPFGRRAPMSVELNHL